MRLILASNNAHKIREFRELVEGMDVELLSQREAGLELDVEETGTTFEANAYIKAKAVTDALGCAAVSDDSGLEVDCLDGRPGVYSARYGGGHDVSDEDKNAFLLNEMGDTDKRSARYVCAICCTMPDGHVIQCRGECEGEMLFAPRGNGGFGYDPIFRPEGHDRAMAELTPDEKNAISHRGKAMREFLKKFEEYLNGNNK
ncbi:MAG: RdgB/HAM1 family non-canonical purine NTP pyrophosphatase [Oscillospiraceae bacterium]|nr:RdgB/HAM1 family non-canonical purine NTP pyrophosphatase [Oscillospiraceae bacterium]